jgi:DNA-binding GntR family transcriptional regulator
VRRLIEVDAARLAAPRVRTPDLLLLERLLRESAQTEPGSWSHGYKQFNHLDQRFHETLIGLAGNRFLVGAFRSLYVHVELGRFYHVFRMVDHRETCSEHEAIFHALGRRDADLAAEAVEAHLKATEVRIFHLIDELAHAPTTPARTA